MRLNRYIDISTDFYSNQIAPILASEKLQVAPDRYTFFVRTESICNATETELYDQITSDLEKTDTVSIYIHFPVCKYVCNFCHYPKNPLKKYDAELIEESVHLLTKEIALFLQKHPQIRNKQISSFYIGGGTPTLMNKGQLKRLLDSFEGCQFADNCERTIEGTPDSLSEEMIDDIIALKFNRISVGIQILDDTKLTEFLRMHRSQQSLNALSILLKRSSIKTNVDLIYGFPGQTVEKLLDDINTIIKQNGGPSSFTLYRLRLTRIGDEETPLMREYKKGSITFPSPAETYIMKIAATQFLEDNGYIEGPIGWLHKTNEQITVYADRWMSQIQLFGFGWKAYSYSQNMQYLNETDYEMYRYYVNSRNELPMYCGEIYNDQDKIRRKLAFNLKYGNEFSFDQSEYGKVEALIDRLQEKGFIIIRKNNGRSSMSLTATGRVLVEEIINSYIFKRIQIHPTRNHIIREIS